MIRVYLKSCFSILLTGFVWGFVLPGLFSSTEDSSLLQGLLVMVAFFPTIGYIGSSITKEKSFKKFMRNLRRKLK